MSTEKDLIKYLHEEIKKIDEEFYIAQNKTLILDLNTIKEQEYKEYYLKVKKRIIPRLHELYKINSTLAEEFISKFIKSIYRNETSSEITEYTDQIFSEDIFNDLYKDYINIYESYKNYYNHYKLIYPKHLKELNYDISDDEQKKIVLEEMKRTKIEKMIGPFLNKNKLKFNMLLKNEMPQAMKFLIKIDNKDLQNSLCNKTDNNLGYSIIKDYVNSLRQNEEVSNKKLKNFLIKYFYYEFNPEDITQENQLPLRIWSDVFIDLQLREEILLFYKNS